MSGTVKEGGFGKFRHSREATPIDKQNVVRMNRDTLYSSAVFDLDAAPVTITLPDPRNRFMSMQITSEDHYAIAVVYAPGVYIYTKEEVGTRYVFMAIRTLADPERPEDLRGANALQDAVQVKQARIGSFEVPNWDAASQDKVRDALAVLGSVRASTAGAMFGRKEEVDPIDHLIGTAIGWGGNPNYAAIYNGVYPKQNDGKTIYRLTVTDVPVDGFWSISVYNAKGYFEKNDLDALGTHASDARKLYDPRGDQTLDELKQQVFADVMMVEPARHFANEMARVGNFVWLYRFAYVSEAQRGQLMGTMHGFEIPFTLNIPAATRSPRPTK
jgi:hypothetical protein